MNRVAQVLGGLLLMAASASAFAQIYRCGNTYGSEPCSGGRQVNIAPSVSVLDSGESNATVYLCQSHGGGKFWSKQHCHSQNALVDRTESVPANMSWENQLAMAKNQRNEAQALTQPSRVYAQNSSNAATAAKNSQCSFYSERVKQLDDIGRRGGGHYTMEWLREERRKVRDEQFRNRC